MAVTLIFYMDAAGCIHTSGDRQSDNIVTASPTQSSNCVVDSRFLLKLTDFGLHSLRRFHLHSSKLYRIKRHDIEFDLSVLHQCKSEGMDSQIT